MSGFSVEGRLALVVGGTRGVGGAISRRLAAAGARVLATYVRAERAAEALATEARDAGHALEVLRADATTPKGLEQMAGQVARAGVPLSVLVFAAATGVHKPLGELTARHFDWTFALNVRAFLDTVVRLSPDMPPGSAVVAISSEGAVRTSPQYTLTGASKGALESMARHMAAELAPRGVRVNILSPGTVPTDAWAVLPEAERRLADAARRSMLGRLNTLDEVAWAAQFLCSDAASGLVGHTLVVDGGARLRG